MAIVKNPALSIQASGNVCGLNFTRWRGLAIVRCAWTGTVPNTPKQVIMQGHMTTASQAWGGILNAADRKTWEGRARTVTWRDRFGSPYIPNGYQLFMKWNIRRFVMGMALMSTAPPFQEWVEVSRFEITQPTGQNFARMVLRPFGVGNITSYGLEYYKAGPYDSGGRHPIDGEWLFLDRRVPPRYHDDLDVLDGKWYWYRGRQIAKFGDIGNWWQDQIQLVFV